MVHDLLWLVLQDVVARDNANNRTVFNSAIVAFAIGVLNVKYPSFFNVPSGSSIIALLQKAGQTLQQMNRETRIVVRCQKYLARVIQVASRTCKGVSFTWYDE